MPVIMIDVLLATLVAVVGLSAGWWLRGILFGDKRQAEQEVPSNPPSETEVDEASQDISSLDEETSREVMVQLHDIACNMASDVGQHSDQVSRIAEDLRNSDSSIADNVYSAVTQLMEVNQRMEQRLKAAEERLGEQQQQLESHAAEALTDALTNLANRRAFDNHLNRTHAELNQDGQPVSLMMIDVDHFKKINDTYGHQAGDEVLRGVAGVLRDYEEGKDVAARYGGEEFAMIYPGATLEQVKRRAEATRAAIAQTPFHFEGVDLQVSASAGLAQLVPGEGTSNLIKRVDEALYASKEAGRDCGHFNNGQLNHPILHESLPEQTMAESFQADETPQDSVLPDESPQRDRSTSQDGSDLPLAATPEIHNSTETLSESPQIEQPEHQTGEQELSGGAAFCEDVSRRIAEWKRGGATACVLLMEIDRYAQILEVCGEEAGKSVIRATKQFLRAVMREMDHAARVDTDKFAMLLPGTTTAQGTDVAQRLRMGIERCQLPGKDGMFEFSLSLGVAEAQQGDEAVDLLQRGRQSLGAARADGGNCCYYHDGSTPVRSAAIQAATS